MGKLQQMIWTEHADYTDLQTQRAVNFGADTIEHATQARGGFVANKIPVTKSVFFSNPENVSNADRTGFGRQALHRFRELPVSGNFCLNCRTKALKFVCIHRNIILLRANGFSKLSKRLRRIFIRPPGSIMDMITLRRATVKIWPVMD